MKTITNPELFMSHEPTKLGEITNQRGQLVEFYEHPTLGDEAPVYAKINGVIANTGFYGLEDFYMQREIPSLDGTVMVVDSDYNPVLTDNNEIMCAFEFGGFPEKRDDTDYKRETVTS